MKGEWRGKENRKQRERERERGARCPTRAGVSWRSASPPSIGLNWFLLHVAILCWHPSRVPIYQLMVYSMRNPAFPRILCPFLRLRVGESLVKAWQRRWSWSRSSRLPLPDNSHVAHGGSPSAPGFNSALRFMVSTGLSDPGADAMSVSDWPRQMRTLKLLGFNKAPDPLGAPLPSHRPWSDPGVQGFPSQIWDG